MYCSNSRDFTQLSFWPCETNAQQTIWFLCQSPNRHTNFYKFQKVPLGTPQSKTNAKFIFSGKNKACIYVLQYQGDELKDTDIPTYLEAKLFCTTFGKFIWVLLQPFFYAFRPLVTYPKAPTLLELVNTVIQVIFDGFVWYFFGKSRPTSKMGVF